MLMISVVFHANSFIDVFALSVACWYCGIRTNVVQSELIRVRLESNRDATRSVREDCIYMYDRVSCHFNCRLNVLINLLAPIKSVCQFKLGVLIIGICLPIVRLLRSIRNGSLAINASCSLHLLEMANTIKDVWCNRKMLFLQILIILDLQTCATKSESRFHNYWKPNRTCPRLFIMSYAPSPMILLSSGCSKSYKLRRECASYFCRSAGPDVHRFQSFE